MTVRSYSRIMQYSCVASKSTMFSFRFLAGFVVLMCAVFERVSSISSLTASPRAADQDGVAGVCPRTQLSFTCSIDGKGINFTTWTSASPNCLSIVSHTLPSDADCGAPTVLQITSVSNSQTNADRSSVALLDNPVNDQIVSCFDGAGTGGTLVGQITLCLIGK